MNSPIPVVENPIELVREWLQDAKAAGEKYHDAISLATIDEDGLPDTRIVLMRRIRPDGFVFFTNWESTKVRQINAHNKAAIGFYWRTLDRQVRIRGSLVRVSDEESDEYFSGRPRLSQLGAWASRQSQEITDRTEFEKRLKEFEAKFEGGDVPRPPHWGGLCLQPVSIEFWREGEWRLHDRLLYLKQGDGWVTKVLSP